jgi:hypothetical protein
MEADVVSSTSPLRQTMRSFSNREKMSSVWIDQCLLRRNCVSELLYKCAILHPENGQHGYGRFVELRSETYHRLCHERRWGPVPRGGRRRSF